MCHWSDREMLDAIFEIIYVKAQYNLDIMAHGQRLVDVSNKMLSGVNKVINQLAQENKNVIIIIIIPMHKNPLVRELAKESFNGM
ncbi:hypothetical protein [Clostridium gasigenes]|uniref:hypothetical protein n=1 Tax=Clostridium gasigenes TaxID=94869 RepID=UPI001C0AF87F|nr:hypothetical protein [Clostridium gasigenes]MBU3106223.1 hypothetical protein [Clostridium gasigenes]